MAIWKNTTNFALLKTNESNIIMTRRTIITVFALIAYTCMMAQSYSNLWKQVETARTKDMPKEELALLDKICGKAEKERQYGHMLKAMMQSAVAAYNISPDSSDNRIKRIEQHAQIVNDSIAKAVMRSALGRIFRLKAESARNTTEKNEYSTKSRQYYRLSLSDTGRLASVKAEIYCPFIVEEAYSRIFDNDLLHVLGYEARKYSVLHDYYAAQGNRHAECITALEMLRAKPEEKETDVRKSKYLQSIDSLINIFGDLKTAGELAVERYRCMEKSNDATAAEKVQYINYAISRWGGWPGLNTLRNAKTELERPAYNINAGEKTLLPQVARTVRVNSIRNISQLDMAVYRLNVGGDTELDPDNEKDYAQLKKHIIGNAVYTAQLKYVGKPAYEEHADSMTIAPLPVGVYLLEVTTNNNAIDPQRCLLHVSDLFTMAQKLPGKETRIVVVNATTGKPVSGAKVRLSTTHMNNEKLLGTVVTGKNGEAIFQYDNIQPNRAYTYTSTDNAATKTNITGTFYYYETPESKKTVINTDRSLYRPGQTIHVSAICWKTTTENLQAEAVAGETMTFQLMNANDEEVEKITATTDEYGQASADFTIPVASLTGKWTVKTGSTYKTIKVEKYRRPTFEVKTAKPDIAYSNGDTLDIKATARSFAGTPIQNAKVKYSVRRMAMPWCRMLPGETKIKELFTDSTETDADGNFIIKMPMILPETKEPAWLYYDIKAVADVTDMAGETQGAAISLPLSNRTTLFTCDLPSKNLADSLETMSFGYSNIAGEKINGTVVYNIDGKEYTTPANTTVNMANLKLKSGSHILHAVCGNDTIERNFIVFTLTDKKPPIDTHDWFYQSSGTFPATIQIGNTDKEHHIYYNVFTKGKTLEKGIMEGHNCLHNRTFNYKEEYGNGITVTYAWVYRGKMYSHTAEIRRPQADKSLNMEWTTFRDKLTPRQDEKWTLKITDSEGKPANAQMIATIYDKSLDALYGHSFKKICQNAKSFFFLPLPRTLWKGGSAAVTGLYGYQDYKMLPQKEIVLSHFDDECFSAPFMMRFSPLMKQGSRIGGMKLMAAKAATFDTLAECRVTANDAAAPIGSSTDNDNAETNTTAHLRSDFSETAFFAPDLTTDVDGNVSLSFTLPESATTWRMLALAHDRQMNSGTLEAEAIASKKVVVQPYMPRFVREGDNTVVASTITNTTSDNIKGTLRMEIIEAETEQTVARREKNFTLNAEGSTAVSINFQLTEGLYICRISASGKGFSDGEQHYLPVLPDKEMVTNTLPFTQTKPGTKTIDLARLMPGKAETADITIEYADNPAWLVMQALPSVSDYRSRDALSLAAAYYATAAAKSIVTGCPELKDALDSWKTDSISLLSDLERNEELKDIVLSETPWMAEAHDEAGQKNMLTNYYNKNNLSYKLQTISGMLGELQGNDGSFGWWKGMGGNYNVTLCVAKLMARLKTFGNIDKDIETKLQKAMKYLTKQTTKIVEEKKKEKSPTITSTDLDYLYLCTIYPEGERDDATVRYLKTLLLKADRRMSIMGKAIAAMVLGKNDKTAKEYIESIKQHTVAKPDMGRYFDSPKASYSWRDYRIPTHVAAIEAIRAITPDDNQTLTEMQLWLLQQKRTQAWETPIVSVDAIHAFLTGNTKVQASSHPTTISMDGKEIALPQPTAKVGYVKTTTQNVKANNITFNKTSEGTSWGAVYAQTLVQHDDIDDASAGIKVERSISGDEKTLKTGDRVKMTITITAERDYDFVHVTDQRAACLEPVKQMSGYHSGYYIAPQDNCTNYFFDRLPKGKHVMETEYYIVRSGTYSSGSCKVQCAYSPAFAGRAKPTVMNVTNQTE